MKFNNSNKMGCSTTITKEDIPKDILKETNQINILREIHQGHQKHQYVHNSFDNKTKYTKYKDDYRIDLSKQYKNGYDSDPETTSKDNNDENYLEIKYKNIKEGNKDNNNNDNKEKDKKKKKKKKKIKYKQKLEELEKKMKTLVEKEKSIEKKQKKQKEKEEEFKINSDKFENNRKNFDKQKKEKLEPFEQKIKELNKKENNLEQEENIYFPKKKPIIIGLNNIGATCYMNASLQCLSNTKELTEYFLNNYKEKNIKKHIIAHEYYELIKNLWDKKNNNKPYSPYPFKEVLSKENSLFAGIQANDSKDLINFLIERLHQELNIIKENKIIENINQINQMNENEMLKLFINEFTSQYNSIISKLFYGMLETKSQCKGCNVIKFNFQLYSFLEFPLQQVNQYYFNNGRRPLFTPDGKNPDVDLYECFEYNRKIDLMNGENQMFCNICNKLCDTLYSTTLYSGPNYLIINLNRGRGAVYECKVNFPEQLNIFNFVTFKHGITVYELYAVICHLGPSSMSGHFVAYCRNRIDNKWYLYNDAFVNLCTRPKQYTEGMPYILFYKALKSED